MAITKLRDSPKAYNNYRNIIQKLQGSFKKSWSLRQIDKALFTFELEKSKAKKAKKLKDVCVDS